MEFGGQVAKYILFIFNFLVMICGILLIVFGSLLLGEIGDVKQFAEDNHIFLGSVAIIVIGSIIFIISFCGCWGAVCENTCLTIIYSIVVLLAFVLQMIMVIYIWIQKDNVVKSVDSIVNKFWNERQSNIPLVDTIQLQLNCCGRNGVQDYEKLHEKVPNSCCGPSVSFCTYDLARPKPGCYTIFTKYFEKSLDIFKIAGIAIAGVELIAFVLACCVANQARTERRRDSYY